MLIMSFPQVYGYDVVEKVGVGSFSVVYKALKKVMFDNDSTYYSILVNICIIY